MNTANAEILLADDDRVDVKAFLRALARLGHRAPVTVARDGQEAWEMLVRNRVLRPLMVVLDINMPKLSGLDVLRRIRSDSNLRDMPVYVLTTSDAESDRLDALHLNCDGYIIKSELSTGLQLALSRLTASPTAA